MAQAAFTSLLQAGILGEVSGEGFSGIFISSPGLPFQGPGLHRLVSSWATAVGPGMAHLLLLLFWAWS